MQDANALRQQYDRINSLLKQARKALPVSHIVASEADTDINRPGRAQGGQDEFEKFMGVGEYEYAWVALVSTARVHAPQPAFWPAMAEAVALLYPHARTPDFAPEAQRAINANSDLRAALTDLASRATDPQTHTAVTALLHSFGEG